MATCDPRDVHRMGCRSLQGMTAAECTCGATSPIPISQEERAVIEIAESWRSARKWATLGAGRAEYNGKSVEAWARDLCDALDALQSSRRPRDYAPDELPPGTRFRFSPGGPVLIAESDALGPYYINVEDRRRSNFGSEDRLIPIQDQD